MIQLKNKEILIDGKPVLLMAGEIHYFRLQKDEWEDRIIKAKEAGCNVIASYTPWLVHEMTEGELDLTGHIRPENDLGTFIDLCAKHDLYFFARPGPYIMAEVKNEGLPFWLLEKYPHIKTTSWDGQAGHHATVQYLHPDFLQETKRWYAAIGDVLKPRMQPNGGNVIAFQLDNEVGMLQWVSNKPDLSDDTLVAFWEWLQERYEEETFLHLYGYPFQTVKGNPSFVRSPEETYSLQLLRDYGHFSRKYFRKYIETLKKYAKEAGIEGVPFVVNIHGTSGNRAHMYPIGISQLYETYWEDPEILPGSDMYLGNVTTENIQDLYISNALMDAVQHPDQPLSAIEFNCGDGNFGDNMGGRLDVSAADLKTRLFVSQGNRLVNYYLIAGGRNPEDAALPKDGNQRIAFTGERHGFAAPINPEGELNYTYPRLAESIQTMRAMEDKLATMKEEHDAVAFGFIPDYYMTEYHYPNSQKAIDFVDNLTQFRSGATWDYFVKGMLLNHFRYPAVDIQHRELDANEHGLIVIPTARYMDATLQQKLIDYVNTGGKLFLHGELPLLNMQGEECRILVDALGLTYHSDMTDQGYYLSVQGKGKLAQMAEGRTPYAQLFEADVDAVILAEKHSQLGCGFHVTVGEGQVMALTTNVTGGRHVVKELFALLGEEPAFETSHPFGGIFLTSTRNASGERMLHILNLDGFDKTFQVTEKGHRLFDGNNITLGAYRGLALPLNLMVDETKLLYSTAEIVELSENALRVRTQNLEETLCFAGTVQVSGTNSQVQHEAGYTKVVLTKPSPAEEEVTLFFND